MAKRFTLLSEPDLKPMIVATHEWTFDLPWHMVDLKDWFYMVNTGFIPPTYFLHVRILGLRSLWKIEIPKQ